MGYSHCELHDEDATNGCESCATEEFERMSLFGLLMHNYDHYDPGRDTFSKRREVLGEALSAIDKLHHSAMETMRRRCSELESENTKLKRELEHATETLNSGNIRTHHECDACKCRFTLSLNRMRQVPCPQCNEYTPVGKGQ